MFFVKIKLKKCSWSFFSKNFLREGFKIKKKKLKKYDFTREKEMVEIFLNQVEGRNFYGGLLFICFLLFVCF